MKRPGSLLSGMLLLLALTAQAEPALFYRSNAIGLDLEPLARFDRQEPYLLSVARVDGMEVRTLYRSGTEQERREILPLLERVFVRGVLSEQRAFDAGGRLLTEAFFSDGILSKRSEYRYGASGLAAVESYDGGGTLLSRDLFELGARGGLRRVRREEVAPAAGGQTLTLVSAGGRLYEERLAAGGRTLVNRYDAAGRLISREKWQQSALAETLRLDYVGAAARPAVEERSVLASGTRTVVRYDEAGRELSRIVSRGEKTLEEWKQRYDTAGRRAQTVRQSDLGLEDWSFAYDDAGKLEREEYRLRGQLERVVRYPGGDLQVQELYREGGLFLIVTFRAGVRVLEQYVEDGAVVRTREFAGGP